MLYRIYIFIGIKEEDTETLYFPSNVKYTQNIYTVNSQNPSAGHMLLCGTRCSLRRYLRIDPAI